MRLALVFLPGEFELFFCTSPRSQKQRKGRDVTGLELHKFASAGEWMSVLGQSGNGANRTLRRLWIRKRTRGASVATNYSGNPALRKPWTHLVSS